MAGLLKNKHRDFDPVWHVQLTMLVAIALQLALPDKYLAGTRYVLVGVELLLLLALSFTTPKEKIFKSTTRRLNVILLIAIVSAANVYSLVLIADQLLKGGQFNNGRDLIWTAINIYLTNIIILGLWYWELDGGGPGQRHAVEKYELDFAFPQQQNDELNHPRWRPTFIDYLYTSATNAMAFSPTDTMPLSRRAKVLMLLQALVSLTTIALVAARAVSILR